LDHLLGTWLELDRDVGLSGGTVSIQNGPIWTAVAFQFQRWSIVFRWKYQEDPLVLAGLVVHVADPSLVSSGMVEGELSQLKE
jgi:hypothetical protein